MATASAATDVGLKVLDGDAHLTEVPDLWTSRLPRKWLEEAPHDNSLSPGPGSWSSVPGDLVQQHIARYGGEFMRKVLWGNAAGLYHLDPEPA